ncbi:DUF680 domain-containing protein [Mesorhizobium sp.]|uniref:DUF680 domain-containing protein n=1 Tax=Mesorhizobium sp. TaxID=1871066 RepID=UPI0025FD2421|nr:DUF680 domain-containing protein [Mesorhizobium sp.]
MTKIAFTAAAILIGMGTAFAGSDNYGSASANRPAASVDTSNTASIGKSDANIQTPATLGADRNLFGH